MTVTVQRSEPLTVVSMIVGWIYFFAWSISFYPQVLLNFYNFRYFLLGHYDPVSKIFTIRIKFKFHKNWYFSWLDCNNLIRDVYISLFGLFSMRPFRIRFSILIHPVLYFLLNSVVGLSFDYTLLNIIGHSSYAIFNCALFFIPQIQVSFVTFFLSYFCVFNNFLIGQNFLRSFVSFHLLERISTKASARSNSGWVKR